MARTTSTTAATLAVAVGVLLVAGSGAVLEAAAQATPVRQCKAKWGEGGGAECQRGGNHAVTFSNDIRSWRFSTHGVWTVFDDGTAQLTGEMTKSGYGSFDLTYTAAGGGSASAFCGATSLADCGLKYELIDATGADNGQCYVHNGGGPVNASSWTLYSGGSGTFVGKGGAAGYEMDLARRGPPLHEGMGAGNKNTGYGVSSWFSWTLTSKGSGIPKFDSKPIGQLFDGDINVDLYDCDHTYTPPEEPPVVGICRCVEVDCTCPTATASGAGDCVRIQFAPIADGATANCVPRTCPAAP